MSRDRCRPFTLLDGMILVAALAVGVAFVRGLLKAFDPSADLLSSIPVGLFGRPPQGWTPRTVLNVWCGLWNLIGPSLMACTVALLILRLRRPRAPWRRLTRQPGAVSILWAVASFLLAIPVSAGLSALFGLSSFIGMSGWWVIGWMMPVVGPGLAGLGISVSWATIAMMGSWRPERGWIDRLGRLLGVVYIANGPIVLSCFAREYLA